jgi:hypothetical protein
MLRVRADAPMALVFCGHYDAAKAQSDEVIPLADELVEWLFILTAAHNIIPHPKASACRPTSVMTKMTQPGLRRPPPPIDSPVIVVATDKIQNFSTLLKAFWPRAGQGGRILH